MNATGADGRTVWAPVAATMLAQRGSVFNPYDAFWWFDKALRGYAVFAYTPVPPLRERKD